MKFNKNKVLDFTNGLINKPCIILGNNGTGKTNTLVHMYNSSQAENKIIISDSYPISSILFGRILYKLDILDQLQQSTLDQSDIEHINILLGKEYNSISFIHYCISDIMDEFFDHTEESYQKLFGSIFDGSTYEAGHCYYYYFKVITKEGLEYDTLTMGIGEHELLSYYLAFAKRKAHSFFIDEPCNYISVKSANNLAKLIIYSSKTKNNKFLITTNSLELIDYLLDYDCPLDFKYQVNRFESIPISKENYYDIYKERYSFYKYKVYTIYVEDKLSRDFLSTLFCDYTVDYIDGSGELTTIARVFNTLHSKKSTLKDLSFDLKCIVFDGDQKDELSDEIKSVPGVFFLPFPDIEKTIQQLIINDDPLVKAEILSFKTDLDYHNAQETARSEATKDAYAKIKMILSFDDRKFFKILQKIYFDEINDFINDIEGFLGQTKKVEVTV